jgi:hypothetical protein
MGGANAKFDIFNNHSTFSGSVKNRYIYLFFFFKCPNFGKLKSFLAENFLNYCLLMAKFHRIQEVVIG